MDRLKKLYNDMLTRKELLESCDDEESQIRINELNLALIAIGDILIEEHTEPELEF